LKGSKYRSHRGRTPRAGTGGGDVDQLAIDELSEAKLSEFAPEPRALDPAERQFRCRPSRLVHEDHAAFDLGGDSSSPLGVGGEDLPGVAVGGNLGLGTSLRLTRAASLELQGTWRRFAGLTDGVYSVSAGIGWNLSNTAASNRDSGYPGTGRFAKPKSN